VIGRCRAGWRHRVTRTTFLDRPAPRRAVVPYLQPRNGLMHTILGANGVIGRGLSRLLAADGHPIRQVGRSPRAENSSDETFTADLLDPRATADAVAGSEVAYLVAGLKYDAGVWADQWPRVMRNAIDACARHGTRLVFFDNVYAYGRVDGVMTEESPFNPAAARARSVPGSRPRCSTRSPRARSGR